MKVNYEFVTRDGDPAFPKFKREMERVQKEIAKYEISLEVKTKALSKKSADYMAYRIKSFTNRKNNSTGALVDSIYQSVRFRRSSKKGFVITVGGPELVDYWAMINYGGFIASGWVPGFWNTDGSFSHEFQEPESRNKSYMYPSQPIKGFHYILYSHVRMLEAVNRMTIWD